MVKRSENVNFGGFVAEEPSLPEVV